MKTIMIAGATSMLGSALCGALLRQGYSVIAIVRENCEKLDRLPAAGELRIVRCDMENYDALTEKVTERIDAAVAFAWNGTRGAERNQEQLQQRNYQCNVAYLHACQALGCRTFLTAGSQAEYGLWTSPEKTGETAPCRPNTEYGRYKLKFYEYAAQYCALQGIRLVEPRFFSLYGPNDYPGTLVMSMLNRMRENLPCELTECVQQWDFLYIDDAVRALVLLLEREDAEGIYNLGYGESAPLKTFVEQMVQLTGSASRLCYGAVAYPETGIVNVNPDVSRLKRLGWKPLVSFPEGIRSILNHQDRKM